MTVSKGTISSDSYTIGGGRLYYNATVGNKHCLGTTNFWRAGNNLGNIVSAEIAPDNTYVEHWKSLNGKRVKDKEVLNTSAVNINFTFDEMNHANLQRFLFGSDNVNSTLAVTRFNVLGNTLEEGCGHLVIETDIGQDFIYRFPKCTLRPDGALSLDPESWHEMTMTLNILEYISGDFSTGDMTATACGSPTLVNASWLLMPFGEVNTTAL